MKTFLSANSNVCPGIWTIGGFGKHGLVYDCSPIYQPSDHTNIRICQSGVVKNARVFSSSVDIIFHLILPAGAKSFCCAIEIETVSGFILHFSQQNHFSF